jgi:hypothetical protein
MNQSRRLGDIRSSLIGLIGALLWGAVEVIALARSRWSRDQRT